ncbi:MAG: hypothetical protein SFX74_08130, partial [Fimbriimonadaceae bacterium]|nr:hypothetical protein [Fimbriimonadaceae bacterium]
MRLSFRVASVVAGLAFVLPSIAQTRLSIGGTHEETFRQGRISYIQRHEQSGKKYLAQYELTYTAGAFRWLRRFVEPSSAIEKESIFVVHPDFEYEVIVRPNGERFVTFDKDRDWALPKDERFEIVPKPNWPLATGFEAKAAPGQKWSYGADDLELSDRTILKFEYEANGLARVTRIADGKVGTRHIYS